MHATQKQTEEKRETKETRETNETSERSERREKKETGQMFIRVFLIQTRFPFPMLATVLTFLLFDLSVFCIWRAPKMDPLMDRVFDRFWDRFWLDFGNLLGGQDAPPQKTPSRPKNGHTTPQDGHTTPQPVPSIAPRCVRNGSQTTPRRPRRPC